jgi:indolepyruvate ferredoxin oxidoreductase
MSYGADETMKIDDRLTAEEGTFYFSGMSMLVRLPLEQAERDREIGLQTGTLITGYPGSPLAGYDLQLAKATTLLADRRARFLPAGNEEQAVTALMGTQMLDDHPHSEYAGVTGFWYGKGPGVDRAGDALKHANFAGTSRCGAVVVLSGEDHEAKSSTMPFQQEYAFVSAGIPILYPSSVAEFRTLGLHAVALSRYSGCWAAMKLVSALCDSGETVTVRRDDVDIIVPSLCIEGIPFAKRADFSFYPGKNIEQERQLYRERHLAVLEYSRQNALNRIESKAPTDRVGIISAGKSAADVRQALADLGIDPSDLDGSGIALLTLGMIYPIDEQLICEFCDGLDELIVVEEKRPFIEDAVRAAAQQLPSTVRIVGKLDEDGRPLFPVEGGMDSDLVASLLARCLSRRQPDVASSDRLRELETIAARDYEAFDARTPNFCSGCPHSTSTVLAEGQVAFGAPGCNCFNSVIEQPERHIDTMTQYGGEGLPWVGLAPFTDRPHLVQHVGDGAIYHSSYLNVRWAAATNTKMTFKILWNGVVANTGAQAPPGEHGLASLTRGLESEGVKRIVICSKDPKQYRRQRLGTGVQLRRADELVAVSQELAEVDGTTVLIYDESCANERRRRIKRGSLPRPTQFALINEDVCEACGDCGAKSNCMSLQKTETEFGPKTRIHESSCNQDFSCLQGECPSFVTVDVREGSGYRKPELPVLDVSELVDPPIGYSLAEPFHIYMPGVGGTGVLTLNALLAFAAMFDGHQVISYDQTGAAQKWGPVLSSLILLPEKSLTWPPLGGGVPQRASFDTPTAYTNKVGLGRSDLYLVLDQVASVSPVNLGHCGSDRTAAVINTDLFPTGQMIRDSTFRLDTDDMVRAIERQTQTMETVPARTIAEKLFGDYMVTNMVVTGAAYQAGLLPLSSTSIERAIVLNGVDVEANTLAFRFGRMWVQDPDRVRAKLDPPQADTATERLRRSDSLRPRHRRDYAALNAQVDEVRLPDETRRLLAVRLAELIEYQSPEWAHRYLDRVLVVAKEVHSRTPDELAIVDAVARNLYKVMAYKDEYEVARLFLRPEWRASVNATFEDAVKVSYNLHPPAARLLGRTRKVRVGPWFTWAFRILRVGRRLRGTRLDPFALQRSRREERELIAWYENLLDTAMMALRPATASTVLAIAELPDLIRGYEHVKSGNAAAAHERALQLLGDLQRPKLPMVQ